MVSGFLHKANGRPLTAAARRQRGRKDKNHVGGENAQPHGTGGDAEVAFRHLDHVAVQIQLAKRQDAVSLTRDYVTELERALAETAGGRHSRAA
jgi:hypothetical protein